MRLPSAFVFLQSLAVASVLQGHENNARRANRGYGEPDGYSITHTQTPTVYSVLTTTVTVTYKEIVNATCPTLTTPQPPSGNSSTVNSASVFPTEFTTGNWSSTSAYSHSPTAPPFANSTSELPPFSWPTGTGGTVLPPFANSTSELPPFSWPTGTGGTVLPPFANNTSGVETSLPPFTWPTGPTGPTAPTGTVQPPFTNSTSLGNSTLPPFTWPTGPTAPTGTATTTTPGSNVTSTASATTRTSNGTATVPSESAPATPTCGGAFVEVCDGRCSDLRNDAANCGKCGNQCPSGSTCSNGACTTSFCASACGNYSPCGPGGSTSCICGIEASGSGICLDGDVLCRELKDCRSTADCGLGSVCAVGTCCGRNVCVSNGGCSGSLNATGLLRHLRESAHQSDELTVGGAWKVGRGRGL